MRLDSPGKTLYRAIQERGGILVHGVNIIRHGVSLREQGLHHLSTVFVLPVMGEGGGKTRLGKHLGAEKHRGGGRGGGASGWSLGRGQLCRHAMAVLKDGRVGWPRTCCHFLQNIAGSLAARLLPPAATAG